MAETSFPESFGRYRVRRELGRGAMGVVYLAEDPEIGRPVAVKVLHSPPWLSDAESSERRLRFEAESRAPGQLIHPGIVTVFDVGREADASFIAMEYVAGESLADRLERSRPLSLAGAADLALQVGRALDFAHQSGVVHRDVKPANILLTTQDQAKITDFGIAKLVDSRVTGSDIVLGTPWYMAPEQILGQTVSGATDQFALGVILFEMVTGTRPFDADHPTSVLYKIVHEPPARALRRGARLAPDLEQVLQRALAKNPEERFGSCGELAAAFAVARTVPDNGSGAQAKVASVPSVDQPPAEPADTTSVDLAPTTRTRPRFAHQIVRLPFVLALLAVSGAVAGWLAWHPLKGSFDRPTATASPVPSEVVLHPIVVGSKPEGAEILIDGERTELRTPQEVTLRGRQGETVRLEVRLGDAVARTDVTLSSEGMDHWSPVLAVASSAAPRRQTRSEPPRQEETESADEPKGAVAAAAAEHDTGQHDTVLAGAKVLVETDPEGASVVVDGAPVRGVTPLRALLFPGSQIRIQYDGYRPWQHVLTAREAPAVLQSGALPTIVLMPAGPLGTLDPSRPTVGAGTQAIPRPELVLPATPILPAGSPDASVRGVVILQVVLDPEGRAAEISILRHLDEVCDQAAIDAVLRRRYAPTFVDGKRVNVRMTETVFFPPGSSGGGPPEQDAPAGGAAGPPLEVDTQLQPPLAMRSRSSS